MSSRHALLLLAASAAGPPALTGAVTVMPVVAGEFASSGTIDMSHEITGAVTVTTNPGSAGSAALHYRDPLEFRSGEVVSVFIDGALLHVMPRQTQIELVLGERSTARFIVVDELLAHRFFLGQEVEIYDTDAVKLFGGVVFTSKRERPQKGVVLHHVACVDYTWLTDNVVVAETFENMTAGAIVRSLITEYLEPEGIFLVNAEIEDGPVVGFHFFDYVSLTQAFNDLSARTGMWWRIGPDRDFQFLARGSVLAPWDVVGDDEIQTATIDDSSPGYRNVQIMRNVRDETPLQLESFAGDGQRRAFTVRYPIARVPTVLLNGVQKTVGIKGVSTGKDWYWASGDGVLAQDDAGPILTTANILEVAYVGFIATTLRFEKESAVAEMQAIQGFGTGRVARVEAVAEVTPKEQAVALAHEMVDRWSEFGQDLEYLTSEPGLFEGMMQQAAIAEFALDDEMLLERITITPTESTVWYRVHAILGPMLGSWSGLYRPEGPYAEQKEDPKGGPAPEIVVVYHDDPGPIGACQIGAPPDTSPDGTTAAGTVIAGTDDTTITRRVLRVFVTPLPNLLGRVTGSGIGIELVEPSGEWIEVPYLSNPDSTNPFLSQTQSIWASINAVVGEPVHARLQTAEILFATDPAINLDGYLVTWRIEDYSPNRIDIYERGCEWITEEDPCVNPKYLWDTREQGTLLEDTTSRARHLEIDENGSWQATPPMRIWSPVGLPGSWQGGGAGSNILNPVEDLAAVPRVNTGSALSYTFATVYEIDFSTYGNSSHVLFTHRWLEQTSGFSVGGTFWSRIFEPTPLSNPSVGMTVHYEADETWRDDASGEYYTFDYVLPNGLHSMAMVVDVSVPEIRLYVDGVKVRTIAINNDPELWPGIAAYDAMDPSFEPPSAGFENGADMQWWFQSLGGSSSFSSGGKQGLSAVWACGQSDAQVAEWHDFLKTIYPGLP